MTSTDRVPTRTYTVPAKLLTVAEFFALGHEDHLRDLELQEGNLVMAASATPRHMIAVKRLTQQLDRQLPGDLELIFEIDVNLELAPADRPGTVRKPDLVAVSRDEYERTERDGGELRARGVLLAVEVMSPSSRRMDTLVKRDEYADAGIQHYWVLDLDPRPSLAAYHLIDGGYEVGAPVTGPFHTDVPFPVTIDLDALV